jgi:hypothetical protein
MLRMVLFSLMSCCSQELLRFAGESLRFGFVIFVIIRSFAGDLSFEGSWCGIVLCLRCLL